jgi:hypothetical protein
MPLSGDRAIKLTTSLYYTPVRRLDQSQGHRSGHRAWNASRRRQRCARAPPTPTRLLQRDPEVKRAIQELKVPTVGSGAVTAATIGMRSVRSTRSIEILCLALAALVLVWSRDVAAVLAGTRLARVVRGGHRGISGAPLLPGPHAAPSCKSNPGPW